MNKESLIINIIDELYFKPKSRHYYYLGITEESYERIKNVRKWLERQNLAKLNEINRRFING